MVVCQCRRVTDRDVRAAIDAGADTVAALGRSCGAGAECRGCHATLVTLLEEERGFAVPARDDRRRLPVVVAA